MFLKRARKTSLDFTWDWDALRWFYINDAWKLRTFSCLVSLVEYFECQVWSTLLWLSSDGKLP